MIRGSIILFCGLLFVNCILLSSSLFGSNTMGNIKSTIIDFFRFRLPSNSTPRLLIASPFGTKNPTHRHTIISSDKVKSRVIIVGDIHGCLLEFKELLDKCRYDPIDSNLILVGDLVNKGPYSAEVIKYARELDAWVVRGNHDDSMLSHANKFKKTGIPLKPSLGYIESLTVDDIAWMEDLPYTISIPSFNALVVHAGLVPGIKLEEQSVVNMYTMRNLVKTEDGYKAFADGKTGDAWVSFWTDDNEPHIYFGHDAKRGLQLAKGATGLDSGCCYGKKLSAIILPSREIVQVDARQVYEAPKST